MDMTGEYNIPAPREKVWEALNDAEILKASVPGCETLEKVSDTEFTATVMAKVGPVRAKFNGRVTLSDMDPPNGYTISGEGQGGAAGFGKGGAKVSLSEGDGGTVLRYEANASVGGKMAQIGSRVVEGVAKKMADDFFATFVEQVSAGEPVQASAAPETAPEVAAGTGGGLPAWAWVVGLLVIVGIGLYLFS
ncbi:MAG: carbon monoxide dehydrogenase [Alphaproteobacteria bacterium]|nr:carbon monoxide dehydrogenase [Alphaproteobacteria bacterium]|tara:strand:+ start:1377 stop:1952 length:576 start_codon:yes stop_codon:yes gene_type:complete